MFNHINTLKYILLLFVSFGMFAQNDLQTINSLITDKLYKAAEIKLKEYIKLNPNNLEAVELLGDAYGYQEMWEAAIEEYKKLVEAQPDNANYQYKYGGSMGMKALNVSKLSALRLLGGIKSSLKKAAELDKTHLGARWALVELYMQIPGIVGGSTSTAFKYAEELEEISYIDGLLAKGYIFEYSDKPDQAKAYYFRAMQESNNIKYFQKNDEGVLVHKAHASNRIHYQIGKIAAHYKIEPEKGLLFINQYIADYSAGDGVPLEWAYLRKAQLYRNIGQKEKAVFWITKALEIRPDFELAQKNKDSILQM